MEPPPSFRTEKVAQHLHENFHKFPETPEEIAADALRKVSKYPSPDRNGYVNAYTSIIYKGAEIDCEEVARLLGLCDRYPLHVEALFIDRDPAHSGSLCGWRLRVKPITPRLL